MQAETKRALHNHDLRPAIRPLPWMFLPRLSMRVKQEPTTSGGPGFSAWPPVLFMRCDMRGPGDAGESGDDPCPYPASTDHLTLGEDPPSPPGESIFRPIRTVSRCCRVSRQPHGDQTHWNFTDVGSVMTSFDSTQNSEHCHQWVRDLGFHSFGHSKYSKYLLASTTCKYSNSFCK